MADVVVTVPRSFTFEGAPGKRGLAAWIAEGDPALLPGICGGCGHGFHGEPCGPLAVRAGKKRASDPPIPTCPCPKFVEGCKGSSEEWGFYIGGRGTPTIHHGERVYVVCEGRVRGYAPLARVDVLGGRSGFALIRRGGAVAVTIPETVKGFRGFRYRWWDREAEVPFPNWDGSWGKL